MEEVEEAADSLVVHMQQRFDHLTPGSDPFTIFRVPAHLRESYKMMYEPLMVSIGPYHYRLGVGKNNLRAMQDHKWRYLRDFLDRYPHLSLELLLGAVRPLEARARACYAEPSDLDSNEFTEMLLLDGCFVVEYLIKWLTVGDPMMHVAWTSTYVRMDLLKIENQIPFFVIQSLYDLIPGSEIFGATLVSSLANFLVPPEQQGVLTARDFLHLLDLFWDCWKTTPVRDGDQDQQGVNRSGSAPRAIPSATELAEAGVRFKPKEFCNRVWDVSFIDGTMEIPSLQVEEINMSRFLNVVAVEQCHAMELRSFTSYAYFMDYLVDKADDVAVLEENGILVNLLSSREDAAHFFNQLSRCGYIDFDDHRLAQLFRDVNQYCGSRWHRNRSKLVRDYFSNPWAIISLVAAVVLLILTFLQTFYAIFAYYNP